MKRLVASVLALSLLLGCASVDSTKSFNGMRVSDPSATPIAHINADTWGIYFFSIPLFYPYEEGYVDIDTTVGLVTSEARRIGANRVTDMQSDVTSVWLPFTFVLFYKECQVSANAVR
ncbi:hypothetical protein GX586_00870 [bacterium]|nr:hypothetical protein [bacterium]